MAGQYVALSPIAKLVVAPVAVGGVVAVANGAAAIAAAGGLVLGVRGGTGTITTDHPETTDTNDTPNKAYGLGNYAMTWQIQCYRQSPTILPHLTGNTHMNLVPQGAIFLAVFPDGLLGTAGVVGPPAIGNYAYIFPTFDLPEIVARFMVEGSSPQSIDFSGSSNGTWGWPLAS